MAGGRVRIYVSLTPTDYAAVQQVATQAGYAHVATWVYALVADRVSALTGQRLAGVKVGRPRKDKGDRI